MCHKPVQAHQEAESGMEKPEVIELDNAKDEVEGLKIGAHWKDHWVIQLITIPGEMHNIFSAPPKQGDLCFLNFGFTFYFPPLKRLQGFTSKCTPNSTSPKTLNTCFQKT